MANQDKGAGVRVSRIDVEQMASAAATIRECRQELAARNGTLLGEITPAGIAIREWQRYPEGEVYDPESHAQFFFHVHPGSSRQAQEYGHFHTFLRAEGMPVGLAPLLLPELAVADVVPPPSPQAAPLKRGTRDEVSHLLAIAIDVRGEPIRLFTTNRWVTGETWYRAEDVIRMLDRFVIAETLPHALLSRWIGAIIQLFRPQIAGLLRARDETVMGWRRRRRTQVFEDPRLEITSGLDIVLDAQLEFVERVRAGSNEGACRAPVLPSMAEGWE